MEWLTNVWGKEKKQAKKQKKSCFLEAAGRWSFPRVGAGPPAPLGCRWRPGRLRVWCSPVCCCPSSFWGRCSRHTKKNSKRSWNRPIWRDSRSFPLEEGEICQGRRLGENECIQKHLRLTQSRVVGLQAGPLFFQGLCLPLIIVIDVLQRSDLPLYLGVVVERCLEGSLRLLSGFHHITVVASEVFQPIQELGSSRVRDLQGALFGFCTCGGEN